MEIRQLLTLQRGVLVWRFICTSAATGTLYALALVRTHLATWMAGSAIALLETCRLVLSTKVLPRLVLQLRKRAKILAYKLIWHLDVAATMKHQRKIKWQYQQSCEKFLRLREQVGKYVVQLGPLHVPHAHCGDSIMRVLFPKKKHGSARCQSCNLDQPRPSPVKVLGVVSLWQTDLDLGGRMCSEFLFVASASMGFSTPRDSSEKNEQPTTAKDALKARKPSFGSLHLVSFGLLCAAVLAAPAGLPPSTS